MQVVIGKPSTIGDTVESKDACGRGERGGWLAVRPSREKQPTVTVDGLSV